jgi:aarF domain-containing kinase
VPSFDTRIAMALAEEQYGCPMEEIFSELTPEPVAAASLGQVYKGTLRSTGDVVALKVPR